MTLLDTRLNETECVSLKESMLLLYIAYTIVIIIWN